MSGPCNPESLIETVSERVARAATRRYDNEDHHYACDEAAYAIIEYLATAPAIYQDVVVSMARLLHEESQQSVQWWYQR